MMYWYVLLVETIFFLIMTVLFEAHWRRRDFEVKTAVVVRVWYYGISILCIVSMASAVLLSL